MQNIATIASLSSLALSIFIALRLFAAAARNRGAPEIAMGTYQGLVVTAIALYVYAVQKSTTLEPGRLFDLVVLANLLIAGGVVALAVGVWRIYRPGSRGALVTCCLLSSWVIGGFVWTATGDVLPTTVAATAANGFFATGRSAVYLWGGIEGVLYHRKLKRRAALGLGDPVVAHRILMWGLFSFTMGAVAVASLTAGVLLGEAYTNWAPGRFITPVLSLVASICLWLGFFPPASYQRFVARNAQAPATTA